MHTLRKEWHQFKFGSPFNLRCKGIFVVEDAKLVKLILRSLKSEMISNFTPFLSILLSFRVVFHEVPGNVSSRPVTDVPEWIAVSIVGRAPDNRVVEGTFAF